MFINLLLLKAADTAKVNPMLYPEEVLIEKLTKDIEGFEAISTKPRRFHQGRKQIDDMCKWRGVTCDEAGEFQCIRWWKEGYLLKGDIHLDWLPRGLEHLSLYQHYLSGTVDCLSLPSKLQTLHIAEAKLSGSVNLERLPDGLVKFDLNTNRMSGSIDLTQLPETLTTLDICHNILEGSLDITKLPASLKTIRLHNNNFTGSIDLTKMHQDVLLSLSTNKLSGSLDLTQLPRYGGVNIYLSHNKFSGSIDINQLPEYRCYINLQDNTLEGEVNIVNIPDDVRIDLRKNNVRIFGHGMGNVWVAKYDRDAIAD